MGADRGRRAMRGIAGVTALALLAVAGLGIVAGGVVAAQSGTAESRGALPPGSGTDICVLADLSASAAGERAEVVRDWSTLTGLADAGPVQFGLAAFADYPVAPYGFPDDVPYQRVTPIGPRSIFDEAVAGLDFGRGGDPSEAQLDAIGRAVGPRSDDCGWRNSTQRILLANSDSLCHGPDETHLASVDTTIAALRATNVVFVGLVAGAEAEECFRPLAVATGGSVVTVGSSDGDLLAAIVEHLPPPLPVAPAPPVETEVLGTIVTPTPVVQVVVPVISQPVVAQSVAVEPKAATTPKPGALAVTGTDGADIALLGIAAIIAGATALLLARRLSRRDVEPVAIERGRSTRGRLTVPWVALAIIASITTIDIAGPARAAGQQPASDAAGYSSVPNDTVDIGSFAPDTAGASSLAPNYFDKSASCRRGTWRVHDQDLVPGVYFADCDVDMINSSGQITVVATGSIAVAGDALTFDAFHDGLLFLAGATGADAITIATTESSFDGVLVAVNGEGTNSGANNVFECGLPFDATVCDPGPDLTITAPGPGAAIDLGAEGTGTGTFLIEGTVGSVGEIVVSYGEAVVEATVDVAADPITWAAEVAGVGDGLTAYEVTVQTPKGLSTTRAIEVDITAPAADDVLLARDVVVESATLSLDRLSNIQQGELRVDEADMPADIATGSVIIVPPEARDIMGPFRRVTSIEAADDDDVILQTEPAFLTDVYNQLELSVSTKLSPPRTELTTAGFVRTAEASAAEIARQFGEEFIAELCGVVDEVDGQFGAGGLGSECVQKCLGEPGFDAPNIPDTCDIEQWIETISNLLDRTTPFVCSIEPNYVVRIPTGADAYCSSETDFEPWPFDETVELAPLIDAATIAVPQLGSGQVVVPDSLQEIDGSLSMVGELDAEVLTTIRIGADLASAALGSPAQASVTTQVSLDVSGTAQLDGSAGYDLERSIFEFLEVPIPRLNYKVPIKLKELDVEIGIAAEFEPAIVVQANGFIDGSVTYDLAGSAELTKRVSLLPAPILFEPPDLTVIPNPAATDLRFDAEGYVAWEAGVAARLEVDLDVITSIDLGIEVGLEERSSVAAVADDDGVNVDVLTSELCAFVALDAEVPALVNFVPLARNLFAASKNIERVTTLLVELRDIKEAAVDQSARVAEIEAELDALTVDSIRIVKDQLDLLTSTDDPGDEDFSAEIFDDCGDPRSITRTADGDGSGNDGAGVDGGDGDGVVGSAAQYQSACRQAVSDAFAYVRDEFGDTPENRQLFLGFDAPVVDGDHICEIVPVYLPGADLGGAGRLREVALDAYPPWISQARIPARSRGWIDGRAWDDGPDDPVYPGSSLTFADGCSPTRPDGFQCDEFPNATMLLGGNNAEPGNAAERSPATVYVTAEDNGEEGQKWGDFLSSCNGGIEVPQQRVVDRFPTLREVDVSELLLVVPVADAGLTTGRLNCDQPPNPLTVQLAARRFVCRGSDDVRLAATVSGFAEGATVTISKDDEAQRSETASGAGVFELRWSCSAATPTLPALFLVEGALPSGEMGSIVVVVPLANERVVLMGDSYTAGNGASGIRLGDTCRRSDENWGRQWIRLIDPISASNRGIGVENLACSGAVTSGGGDNTAGQIARLREDAGRIVLTTGGNDLNFSSLVSDCLVVVPRRPTAEGCQQRIEDALSLLPQVQRETTALLRDINAKAPDARIALVGYPHLVDNFDPPYMIDDFDAQGALRDLARRGEAAQIAAVAAANASSVVDYASFVSVKPVFDGHAPTPAGVETTRPENDIWLVPQLSSFTTADWYHYNPTGHEMLAGHLALCLDLVSNACPSAGDSELVPGGTAGDGDGPPGDGAPGDGAPGDGDGAPGNGDGDGEPGDGAPGDGDGEPGDGDGAPGEDPPAEEPPGEDPPAEEPPGEDPPAEEPPAEEPPAEEPPVDDPPSDDPPSECPPNPVPVIGESLTRVVVDTEGGNLNFRDIPSAVPACGSRVIGPLAPGTELDRTGRYAGPSLVWARVTVTSGPLAEQTGWVASDFLRAGDSDPPEDDPPEDDPSLGGQGPPPECDPIPQEPRVASNGRLVAERTEIYVRPFLRTSEPCDPELTDDRLFVGGEFVRASLTQGSFTLVEQLVTGVSGWIETSALAPLGECSAVTDDAVVTDVGVQFVDNPLPLLPDIAVPVPSKLAYWARFEDSSPSIRYFVYADTTDERDKWLSDSSDIPGSERLADSAERRTLRSSDRFWQEYSEDLEAAGAVNVVGSDLLIADANEIGYNGSESDFDIATTTYSCTNGRAPADTASLVNNRSATVCGGRSGASLRIVNDDCRIARAPF